MYYERKRSNKFSVKNYIYFLATLVIFSILLSVLVVNADVFSAQTFQKTNHDTLDLVNLERIKYDSPQLKWSEELAKAAQDKAQDMVAHKYFEHFSPEGKSPWSFIESNDYNYISAGENLAIDFTTINDAEQALEASPTHLLNIVNPQYREFGAYMVEGDILGYNSKIYVQMFGSRNKVIDRIFYNLNQ